MHDHGHHHHHHEHASGKSLKLAFFLNTGFTILELIGGLLTNSVAILSDAVHDLGDSIALGLALWTDRVSRTKEADFRSTYGYRRLTLLSSLLNALILTGGSVWILTEAVPRLWEPEEPHSLGMIGIAIVGVLANGWAVLSTRGGKSMNEQVISWHLLEDVLGWIAVLIGAVLIHFTEAYWIDPLLAIGISLFILYNIVRRLRDIVRLFLQQAPDGVDVEEIKSAIEACGTIASTHHLHAWSLDGEHHVLTVHAVLKENSTEADYRTAKEEVRKIAANNDFAHVTVEVEYADENCGMRGDCSSEA